MKKLLFILLVLPAIYASGQTVWEITNTPTGGTIWDIEGSEQGYLFTITGSGIYRSNNNGTNWEPVYFENGIIRVLTVTESGDVYAGYDSLLLRSTDNGTTWNLVFTASGNFISLTSDSFNTVYGSTMGENGEMTLLISADGGANWVQKSMAFASYSHLNLHINSVGHIFSASFEGLYKSVDQGDTWELIYNGQVRSLVIDSNDNLIVGGFYDYWLYKSTDNGSNWYHFYNAVGIYPLAEDDEGYIYAPSDIGLLRISSDGLNWSQIDRDLPTDDIYTIYVNHDGVVFVGNDGIHKSIDNGVNWTFASDGLNADSFTYIYSSPDGHIYAISDALYVSTDEGESYSKLVEFYEHDKVFTKVYIHPDGDIFAIGYNRYYYDDYVLFRSSDNGTSFSEMIHIHIYDFAIANDGSIYLATENGLMRSNNKGDSWELLFIEAICYSFYHVLIDQTGTIYLGGCQGTYTSSDNGVTFTQVSDITFDLKASNSEGDVFAIYGNDVYRTIDNGISWEIIYTNELPYNQLRDLVVDAYNNVYFNLSFFGILKSTDNGDTWTLFNEGLVNDNVIAIHAASNGILYVSPEYNGVWKRSAGPTLANSSGTLEVYPNPTREKINIRLSIDGVMEKDICRIYDMQGRIMKELVISASSNEVGLEGFKPGVYLVKSANAVEKILVQ